MTQSEVVVRKMTFEEFQQRAAELEQKRKDVFIEISGEAYALAWAEENTPLSAHVTRGASAKRILAKWASLDALYAEGTKLAKEFEENRR